MLEQPRVWTFFYGSFMNREVCAAAGVELGPVEVALVRGRELHIMPLATLIDSPHNFAYGLLARMSHGALTRLYSLPWVTRYVPEPVMVETLDGRMCAALVYVRVDFTLGPAAPDYVERVAAPAREHGFPDWYVRRIEAFGRPSDD